MNRQVSQAREWLFSTRFCLQCNRWQEGHRAWKHSRTNNSQRFFFGRPLRDSA